MTCSPNTSAGAADTNEESAPGAAPTRREGAAVHAVRLFGEAGLRPAPANWRGCGYRRSWTTANGAA